MQLRVLTLNIWGVRFIAKFIDQRLRALVEHLNDANNKYDIIGLQEVWSKADYVYLRDQLKTIYPHSYYFLSGFIGSGCCVFSKHAIISVYEHRYSLNGFPHKIQHGDWFCGKLIGLCKILVGDQVINVYNTHLHANYHHVIPKDIYLGHRICQAYELIQFIESTSSADSTDLTLLLGDLNLRTTDLGFQLIQSILQLHDSFLQRVNKDSFDPTIGNSGRTCDLPDNPYVKPNPNQGRGDRIDFILYRSRHDHVKCMEAYPILGEVPHSTTGLYYSDHLAVYARFEVDDRKLPTTSEVPTDGETRALLRSACVFIEETIQRIQRDRLFCALIVFSLTLVLFLFNTHLSFPFVVLKQLLCFVGLSISTWLLCLGKPLERNALRAVQNAMQLRLHASKLPH